LKACATLEVRDGKGLALEATYRVGHSEAGEGVTWHQLGLSAYQPFELRRLGKLTLAAHTGLQTGEAPYPSMFVFPASGISNIWGENYTFQTQPINGWTATRYAIFFSRLDIDNNRFPAQVYSPNPSLYFNTGWGALTGMNRNLHEGFLLQAPTEGLYEVGMSLKDLFPKQVYRILPFFRDFALGFYVQMGLNASNSFRHNYAIKLQLDNFLPQ
jgi:hypothetical protein